MKRLIYLIFGAIIVMACVSVGYSADAKIQIQAVDVVDGYDVAVILESPADVPMAYALYPEARGKPVNVTKMPAKIDSWVNNTFTIRPPPAFIVRYLFAYSKRL